MTSTTCITVPKPYINVGPSNTTAYVGSTIVLPCSAKLSDVTDRARHTSGDRAPTSAPYTQQQATIRYFWFHSDTGSDLSEARYSRDYATGSLQIDGVRMADEGEFVCVAANAGGRDVAVGYLDVIGTVYTASSRLHVVVACRLQFCLFVFLCLVCFVCACPYFIHSSLSH